MASEQHAPMTIGGRTRAFTRRDYDNMIRAGILGEDERLELIGGRILMMNPEGPQHAGAIELCAEVLHWMFDAGHTVLVQHPLAVDPDDEPEPDLAVVRDDPRDQLADHPHEAVLIVEVAEASLERDRGEKALLYARAGFTDYWIVNLIDRCVEVHRDPTPDGYLSVVSLAAMDEIVPLAAPSSRLAVAALLP